jgi:GT2 family glycosyltransferase
VRSLLTAGADIQQVSVVDNRSSDNSVAYLEKAFENRLLIIQADKNRGYPHGLNLGIQRALQVGAKWVLLMNNDTEVDSHFLSEMYQAAQNNPNYTILCPLILYFSDPQQIWYFTGKRIPGTLLYWHPYRFKRLDQVHLPSLLPGDFAHGCALFVKREVFEQIGLFDDTSLIYGDDVDFSFRARSAGIQIGAVSAARMWHKVSTTMNRMKPKTRYLRIRNQNRFYRTRGNLPQRALLFVFTILRCGVMLVRDLFARQTDLLNPTLRGWAEGWFGKISRDIP